MKKLIAILLLAAVLLCLAGCNKNEDDDKSESSAPTLTSEKDTTNEETSQTPKGEETNTDINISADIDVMLDILTEAETIYNCTNDIISDYNDDVITPEDTVAKFKAEQGKLDALLSKVNTTEWKSEKYENSRKKQLDIALKDLNIFFESAEKAFSESNNALIAKANAYLNSYASSSYGLFNDVQNDGKHLNP